MKTRIAIVAAAAILTGCAGGPTHASPPPNPAGTPNQPVVVPPSVAPAPVMGPSSRGPAPAWVPTDRPQDLGGLLGGSEGGSFLPYYLETLRGNTPPDNACTAPTDLRTLLAPCDQPDK